MNQNIRIGTRTEIPSLTGRSRVSIWRAMSEGRLCAVKLYDRGVNLIPESELIKLIGGGE